MKKINRLLTDNEDFFDNSFVSNSVAGVFTDPPIIISQAHEDDGES